MAPSIDPRELARVFRQPTFHPTDCPNFLTYRDLDQYKWYARLLAPMLVATGGGPHFIGDTVATLEGERVCDTWMVVRYRSHRHMLAMITTPYYLFVNRFRERGTARLELAFTAPRNPKSGLDKARFALAIHTRGADATDVYAALRTVPRPAGVEVVYESESRYDFSFVRSPRPRDPNPLTYPVTIAFGASDDAPLRALAASEAFRTALAVAPHRAVALYRRASVRKYL